MQVAEGLNPTVWKFGRSHSTLNLCTGQQT